ncbi:MAG: aminoacyl-tRNA hydrolase [Coriobacteriaceae bacterium]|jgi:PTH1 family peptidyl-tRNA hydrolase|nr:aminoacyl-tRNA hydrolase [Coriobacteriaceae bacterium]
MDGLKAAGQENAPYLIVGLGNPGEQYAHTRHNAGFDVIDILASGCNVRYWKNECGSLTAKAVHHGHDLVLAKPQGYMNTSGGPVKQLSAAYGITPDHLIVVHDELDIEAGVIRVKFGGGHAGHNGLRSLCDKLGTRDWFRVRIGIGRPPGRMAATDYVLTLPKKDALESFEHACGQGAQAVLSLIDCGLEKTQQQFNTGKA